MVQIIIISLFVILVGCGIFMIINMIGCIIAGFYWLVWIIRSSLRAIVYIGLFIKTIICQQLFEHKKDDVTKWM